MGILTMTQRTLDENITVRGVYINIREHGHHPNTVIITWNDGIHQEFHMARRATTAQTVKEATKVVLKWMLK